MIFSGEINKCYVGVSKNESQMLKSSSGGIFPLLAEKFINDGGIVFGAAYYYDEKNKIAVRHQSADKVEEIAKLQNSKYVQSSINNSYLKVKELIKQGKKVLFSGTPCQVAALKQIVGNPPNLFTVEVICHGIPSTKIFQDYLSLWETKHHCTVKEIQFRDKSLGWGKVPKIIYENKKGKYIEKVFQFYKSSYFLMFLKGDILRESCFNCKYSTKKRASDITLGDYWGIESSHPELSKRNGGVIDFHRGVSCILCNSSKAEYLMELIEPYAILKESKYESIAPFNLQVVRPFSKGVNREDILNNYIERGYKFIDKQAYHNYLFPTLISRFRKETTDFFKQTIILRNIYNFIKKLKDRN